VRELSRKLKGPYIAKIPRTTQGTGNGERGNGRLALESIARKTTVGGLDELKHTPFTLTPNWPAATGGHQYSVLGELISYNSRGD